MEEGENYTDKININKLTIENALAISSLTQIVSNTSKDVDRLVKHAEKIDKLVVENSKLDGRLGHLEGTVQADKKKLSIVFTILQYPKITAFVLMFLYTLTIYEVRTAMLKHLAPIANILGWK